MPDKYYTESELAEMDEDQLNELASEGTISAVDLMTIKALQTGALDDEISMRRRIEKEQEQAGQ